jgi:hypothetical protein
MPSRAPLNFAPRSEIELERVALANSRAEALAERRDMRAAHPHYRLMRPIWAAGDDLLAIQVELEELALTPANKMALHKACRQAVMLPLRLDKFVLEEFDEMIRNEVSASVARRDHPSHTQERHRRTGKIGAIVVEDYGETIAREELLMVSRLHDEVKTQVAEFNRVITQRYDDAEPDPEVSWKYHQETTMPLCVIKPPEPGQKRAEYRKLESGELAEGATHYSVWHTPVNEIGDFGIGLLLYFRMLISLGVLAFVLGMAACQNITRFASDDYSNGQPSLPSVSILRGSAVCDDYEAVCVSEAGCDCTFDRETGTISGDGCMLKLDCPLTKGQGFTDLAIAIIFLLFNMYLSWKHENITTKADESEQTAQDYSIMVDDPDPDATDPDEWQKFFEQFGHVTYVTVALNNSQLIKLLGKRKFLLQELQYVEGSRIRTEDELTDFDKLENDRLYKALPLHQKLLGLMLPGGKVVLRHKLGKVDAKVEKITSTKTFAATKVFVVFEKEEVQRAALAQLTMGIIPAHFDTVSDDLPPSYIFRGTNVLSVREAPEPTDILWEHLEVTRKTQFIQCCATLFVALCLIAACTTLIYYLNEWESTGRLAAVFISVANAVMPPVLKQLNNFEQHFTEGSRQTSLLIKLVFLRWMTTGFIVFIIRTDTLGDEFIGKVWAVLLADAVTTPIIRLLDLPGKFKMYFLAKSSPSQDKMNSYFDGTAWFLAERYTDMTKTLFVSLFFNALFPAGFFVTAIAFFVNYWVDKYSLLRTWKQPPAMDGTLAAAARLQVSLIFLVHCFVTMHFYAGWPFDDVTLASSDAMTVMSVNGEASAAVPLHTEVHQEIYNFFNFYEQSWYSADQFAVVRVYAIVNIVGLCLFVAYYFGNSALHLVHALFYGSYDAVGRANDDEYSFVPGIETYVPQIHQKGYGNPLIATDTTLMDTEHCSFTVADYAAVNLSVTNIFLKIGVSKKKAREMFSHCKQYKPEKLEEFEAKGKKTGARRRYSLSR